MLALGFGLLGMVIGSFLNVCIDRLPEGQSIVSPPSHCPSCQRPLQAYEMIPLVSYLILGGRCRTCGERIPFRVLLVELGTGLIFSLIWLRFGLSWETLFSSAYVSFLIPIGVIDLKHQKILNVLSYPAILTAAAAALILHWESLGQYLLGAGVGFGVLFLLAAVSPGAMGFGDIKLVLFLGLAVGFPLVVLVLFLAFVIGGAAAGILLLAGKVGRKDPIAFGPYLALAGVITLLYGNTIITWWLRRIGG